MPPAKSSVHSSVSLNFDLKYKHFFFHRILVHLQQVGFSFYVSQISLQ